MSYCRVCNWEDNNHITVTRDQPERYWVALTGIAKSTINRHLNLHAGNGEKQKPEPTTGYKWEQSETEFDGQSTPYEHDLDVNDVEQFLQTKGLNPNEWDYTFRFSEWEQRTKDGETHVLHAFKVSGKRKQNYISPEITEPILDVIRSWKFEAPAAEDRTGSFIICPADLQIGKVDWNGGSPETVKQVMQSFRNAAQYCIENKPAEIVVIDAGDIVENIWSTSSQLGTNDLGLPHQISVAFELMLAGIKMLAPLAPSIRYVAVPSNHGQHRLSYKSPAGAVHEDWGLMLARILDTAAEHIETLQHLEVVTTGDYYYSLSFETSESYIGVLHGHQTGSPDNIGKWWAGQSHGEMPTARARILITGHWHSFRVQQSGNERWVMVCPSSDRGSSWFTNNKGERSTTGMLGFSTANNEWWDLQIF